MCAFLIIPPPEKKISRIGLGYHEIEMRCGLDGYSEIAECWVRLERLLLDFQGFRRRRTLLGVTLGSGLRGSSPRRKRNPPEARVGVANSIPISGICSSRVDVFHGTDEIFAGPHMVDTQNLPNHDSSRRRIRPP